MRVRESERLNEGEGGRERERTREYMVENK